MDKIHPLFYIVLLVIVSIVVDFKQVQIEQALSTSNANISNLEKELSSIATLKQRWQGSEDKLDSLLKNPLYSGVSLERQKLKDREVLIFEGMSDEQFSSFVNKVLNSYIKIHKLDITRDENKKITLRLEVKI